MSRGREDQTQNSIQGRSIQGQSEVEIEAIRICQDLIRIPSVNYGEGQGDEAAIAEYIVSSLAEVGITGQIFE